MCRPTARDRPPDACRRRPHDVARHLVARRRAFSNFFTVDRDADASSRRVSSPEKACALEDDGVDLPVGSGRGEGMGRERAGGGAEPPIPVDGPGSTGIPRTAVIIHGADAQWAVGVGVGCGEPGGKPVLSGRMGWPLVWGGDLTAWASRLAVSARATRRFRAGRPARVPSKSTAVVLGSLRWAESSVTWGRRAHGQRAVYRPARPPVRTVPDAGALQAPRQPPGHAVGRDADGGGGEAAGSQGAHKLGDMEQRPPCSCGGAPRSVNGGLHGAGPHQPNGSGSTVAGGGVAWRLGSLPGGSTSEVAAACMSVQPERAWMQAGVPCADATPLSCPTMPRCQALLLGGSPRARCPSTTLSTHVLTGSDGVCQVFSSVDHVAVVAAPTSFVLAPHPPSAAACGCVGVAALVPPRACAWRCAATATASPLLAGGCACTAAPVRLTCASCLPPPPLPTAPPPPPPMPAPPPPTHPPPDAPVLLPCPPANAPACPMPGAWTWPHAPPRGAGVPPPPSSVDAGWPYSLARLGEG